MQTSQADAATGISHKRLIEAGVLLELGLDKIVQDLRHHVGIAFCHMLVEFIAQVFFVVVVEATATHQMGGKGMECSGVGKKQHGEADRACKNGTGVIIDMQAKFTLAGTFSFAAGVSLRERCYRDKQIKHLESRCPALSVSLHAQSSSALLRYKYLAADASRQNCRCPKPACTQQAPRCPVDNSSLPVQ